MTTLYGAELVCGKTGGLFVAVDGDATTTFVRKKPVELFAAVKFSTIVVDAPAVSGPILVQLISPSLVLSTDAGTALP